MTRDALLLEHQRLSDSIASGHRVLGRLIAEERPIKVEAFLRAEGSDRVRASTADQAALHLSTQILQTQHELDALQAEVENVRMQLAYMA